MCPFATLDVSRRPNADEDALECVARPQMGEHGWYDDELWDVVLYTNRERRSKKPSEEIDRLGPMCIRHARYEVDWRAAVGAIALGRIERHQPAARASH